MIIQSFKRQTFESILDCTATGRKILKIKFWIILQMLGFCLAHPPIFGWAFFFFFKVSGCNSHWTKFYRNRKFHFEKPLKRSKARCNPSMCVMERVVLRRPFSMGGLNSSYYISKHWYHYQIAQKTKISIDRNWPFLTKAKQLEYVETTMFAI